MVERTSPLDRIEQAARDAETVRLLKDHDANGLARLLRDHAPSITAVLRRELAPACTREHAEDAVQEGARLLWHSVERFDPEKGSIRAWFLTICLNAARKALAREAREPVVRGANLDRVVEIPRAPEPDPERARFVKELHKMIAKLPAQQRAILRADLRAGGLAGAAELARQLKTTK